MANDIDAPGAERVTAEIAGQSDVARFVGADVGRSAECARLVEQAISQILQATQRSGFTRIVFMSLLKPRPTVSGDGVRQRVSYIVPPRRQFPIAEASANWTFE